MQTNSPPSIDPADLGHLSGLFKSVLRKYSQTVDGMLPAKIISFNRAQNTAMVQPLIQLMDTSDNRISRPPISTVPVFQNGGGGFVLNFNLNPGDLGWIIANDRDITSFLKNLSESVPSTYRIKNFADAVFFPQILSPITIASTDSEAAVLQSNDGTVKIALATGQLTLSAPMITFTNNNQLQITTNTVTINANSINLTAPVVTITGNLAVNGNITATGSITPNS